MLHVKDRQKYSLDEWEAEFDEIYGRVDQQRTPAEMWLLMMEDASQLAEAIRREKYAEALRKLVRVFGWTCSFVARCRAKDLKDTPFHLDKNLSEIVWQKYPYCCSLCGNGRCICAVVRGELEELSPKEKKDRKARVSDALAVARQSTDPRPKTLDDFVNMFSHIYKGAHYNLPIEAIFLHFMEEVGEVSSCIREIREKDGKKRNEDLRADLEEEIADIISWTASALSKLDYILGASRLLEASQQKVIQTSNLALSAIVWQEFQDDTQEHLWCGKCRARQCKCIPYRL
jgi:NTP pyrophosphatase (non-canonical NTP hydrolase)